MENDKEAIWDRIVREDLFEEVPFEQRSECEVFNIVQAQSVP